MQYLALSVLALFVCDSWNRFIIGKVSKFKHFSFFFYNALVNTILILVSQIILMDKLF